MEKWALLRGVAEEALAEVKTRKVELSQKEKLNSEKELIGVTKTTRLKNTFE